MAIKKLTLTEDHLRLIRYIKFEKFNFAENDNTQKNRFGWGIDQYSLFGGNFLLEDVAIIIGKYDQMYPDTKEDANGPRFPIELENYMWDLYEYIYTNMEFIESLVHQFVVDGGLKPGTYKCIDHELFWERVIQMEKKTFLTDEFYENPQLTLDAFNELSDNKYQNTIVLGMYGSGGYLYMLLKDNDEVRDILSDIISDFDEYKKADIEAYMDTNEDEISVSMLNDEYRHVFGNEYEIMWDKHKKIFMFAKDFYKNNN